MLSESLSITLAPGAVNANIFANSRYATLSRPARVTYYAVQFGATGLTTDQLLMEITHGNVIVRSNSPVPLSTVGATPNKNENMVASAVADINDRIVIRLQNDGAATSTVAVIVDIDF
jgi:hypothetical protein